MSPGLMGVQGIMCQVESRPPRYRTARSPPSMNSGAHEGAQETMCQVGIQTPQR